MNINAVHLNIAAARTFTLTPGEAFNPFDEVTVRDIWAQQDLMASGHIAGNDDRWGPDLDPAEGRILRVGDLGEATYALAVTFDPETQQPQTLDLTTQDGSYEKHVRWEGDDVTWCLDRRGGESVEVHFNPGTGVITYLETPDPPI